MSSTYLRLAAGAARPTARYWLDCALCPQWPIYRQRLPGAAAPVQAQPLHRRCGEGYDNAQAESRWSHLTMELLELRD